MHDIGRWTKYDDQYKITKERIGDNDNEIEAEY